MTKTSELQKTIDKAIREIWEIEIIKDYKEKFLLKEDTLKNALYFHLRNKLGDEFLDQNRLRIFTEYYMKKLNGKIPVADLVVAELKPENECNPTDHLRDRVQKLLCIVELKYKCSAEKQIAKDVYKIRDYIKSNRFPDCHFYLGVIYEQEKKSPWVKKSQRENWAKDRLTELNASYDETSDKMVFKIIP